MCCLLELKRWNPAYVMQTRKEFTAIHLAAQYGHAPVVEELCEHSGTTGFDFSASNTPLMLAVRYGHTEVVELLL